MTRISRNSVMEVIETAEPVCGEAIRAERAHRRSKDAPTLVGSAARAAALLGWAAARTSLRRRVMPGIGCNQKSEPGQRSPLWLTWHRNGQRGGEPYTCVNAS